MGAAKQSTRKNWGWNTPNHRLVVSASLFLIPIGEQAESAIAHRVRNDIGQYLLHIRFVPPFGERFSLVWCAAAAAGLVVAISTTGNGTGREPERERFPSRGPYTHTPETVLMQKY